MLSVSPVSWLLALSPIVAVLVLMVGFKWGGSKAGPVGWLVALVVGLLFFGLTPQALFYSQIRALLLSLYVLYIIWMALVLYHVVNEAGAIEVIGRTISRLTKDRVLQLLILSWGLSTFLQGVAGFGVPIAVVAPLLIVMGFSPVISIWPLPIRLSSMASRSQRSALWDGNPGSHHCVTSERRSGKYGARARLLPRLASIPCFQSPP